MRLIQGLNFRPLLFVLLGLGMTACGSDINTPWQKPPTVKSGGDWGPGPCASPAADGSAVADGAGCQPSGTPDADKPIHNTDFCSVAADGTTVQTGDIIHTDREGDVVHTISGGCIARPIRDVWGVLMNFSVMKPDDVDDYTVTNRSDLVPDSSIANTLFAFDIKNTHHAIGGLINPSWVVRWYFSLPYGTYESPDEVAADFQKVQGTSHIRSMKGGYVLDRTSKEVTSYVLEQWIDADSYDEDHANKDMNRNFQRFRTGDPDWGQLPPQP